MVKLLRASHIKPWRTSSNHERLDHYNGLLLNPNLDVLFDYGYISFNNEGTILISEELQEEEKNILDINEKMALSQIEDNHQEYLEFHRNSIFKR